MVLISIVCLFLSWHQSLEKSTKIIYVDENVWILMQQMTASLIESNMKKLLTSVEADNMAST